VANTLGVEPQHLLAEASLADDLAVDGGERFTPVTLPDGRRTYRLEADLTLGRIFAAEVHNKVHVPDGD
jgi:hypothetical protein